MDIRQSAPYARFMQSLGWKVARIGKWNAFIRHFPIIGSFIKIQRIGHPFPEKEIVKIAKKHRAFKVIIEPDFSLNNLELQGTRHKLHDEIFAPSKTILIDLTPTEKDIFNRFSGSKRRAVRRAEKNEIIVKESTNIGDFVKLKSKQMFPFGFLLSKQIKMLWQIFAPHRATLLLANHHTNKNYYNSIYYYSDVLAGVILLFWQKRAYYWLASATDKGKRLSAPTLLVWEALKLSKKKGCTTFDFEGIFDPRFPKATNNWQGFTKFKEGFGGKEIQYPKPFRLI